MLDTTRVRRGATAARISAIAGGLALAAIALFFTVGEPFGTINDALGLVMIAALAPVMLAHYELGGVVPLWPARLSLAGALLAVATWSLVQVAFVLRILNVNVNAPAAGGWELLAILQVVIGLWIAGASLLAGRWLPPLVRTLGMIAGVGVVVMSVGILRGGYSDMLTNVGGVGYQIVLPVWAWLLSHVFQRAADAATAARASAAA
ncbi:MAG: hypothetical protein HY263_05145 [Chloroflexi bacterium]|nr:hypothetical protein [Chloroflexota bacterium]